MAVYTVTTYEIQVVGNIWMPSSGLFAYTYKILQDEAKRILELPEHERREVIQDWLDTHAGDFSRVTDFNASLADWESGWATEEGELVYGDCMFREEE